MSLFVAVWTIGSGVKFARLLFALARQRTLLAALTDVKDGDVSALADHLRHRLGIRRPVRLMSFPHAPWPFTVGLLPAKARASRSPSVIRRFKAPA